jgi:hypothetical protein
LQKAASVLPAGALALGADARDGIRPMSAADGSAYLPATFS